MARIKFIDSNPCFIFECSSEMEDGIKNTLHENFLQETLDGEREVMTNGDIKYTIHVDDENKANALSQALKLFRIDFYGLNKIATN